MSVFIYDISLIKNIKNKFVFLFFTLFIVNRFIYDKH